MIELYEKVESTNDLALEAADRGAEAGRCWVADHQTKGRGQRNRDGERNRWFSPPDANIYASLLLRPDLEPSRASAMSLAAGVALAGAIESRGEVELWIKWPNDLYIGERKLAGILTEASTADGELSAVVVGFGLNVNATEEQFEGELAGRATSLRAETGRRWDRMGLSLEIRRRLLVVRSPERESV
ncbi:MAG: biotin--[acetyl-CoA-carboxylase] ligase, partial [Bradymonadaceae bacterium]